MYSFEGGVTGFEEWKEYEPGMDGPSLARNRCPLYFSNATKYQKVSVESNIFRFAGRGRIVYRLH